MLLSNFSVSVRLYILVGLLLSVTAVVSAVGLWKMDKLGSGIEAIAERDVPLTTVFTNIAIHQFEQAVVLEKAGSAIVQRDQGKLKARFEELGHKVEGKLEEATALIQEAAQHSNTESAQSLLKRLAGVAERVSQTYAAYRQEGLQVFDHLATGDNATVEPALVKAEDHQEELEQTLVSVLDELSGFTQDAASGAETDEQRGITLMAVMLAVGLVFGLLAAIFVGRSISVPALRLSASMRKLADGDTDVSIEYTKNKDEVGHMARAVEVFRQNAKEVERLSAQQEIADRKAAEERAELLGGIAERVETEVGEIAARMAQASQRVKQAASDLRAAAEDASGQSTTVAGASEQASNNVQTVASAAEELSSSVNEISRQVMHSTDIAKRAVAEVRQTNDQVQGLNDAANKIGEVVALISDIAEQTNLLALNATIEAARAGEAGKGFAVVAQEVKNLAGQTAKATDDISTQVSAIQNETKSAVDAILHIGQVIEEMSDVSSSIAAAVEEQSAASQEIARNVEEAAAGTNEVSSSIGLVANAARTVGDNAGQLLDASEEMSGDSDNLGRQGAELANRIRAA